MSVTPQTEVIVINRIRTDREPNQANVEQLKQSIAVVGVIHQPILWRKGTGLGIELVVGGDRLEACKQLKQKSISARVVNGDTSEIRAWIAQVLRDENAIRTIAIQSRPALKLVASN